MKRLDDSELLAAYAAGNSEEAFTELADRYVALVYSAAMRQVGEPQLAGEITQAVFLLLARKARAMSRHATLSGWLCRVAYFVSRDALRAERRRLHREQIALQMQNNPADESWTRIAPLLDEAVAQLSAKDRSAIVLRYYEQKSLGEVGSVLGVNSDTAQKRVSRALEKLRRFFVKRGVASTTAMIAGAITANSVQAAPSALAKSVTAIAMAKGAAASGSSLTLIKGALKIMAWSKAKTVLVAAAVAVLTATTVTVGLRETRSRAAYPGDWIWEPNSQTLARVPPMILLRPSKRPVTSVPFEMFGGDRYLAEGKTVKELLASVYSQKDSRAKLTFPANLPEERFDCIVTLPNWWDALESEINKRYHLVTQYENRGAGSVVVVQYAP